EPGSTVAGRRSLPELKARDRLHLVCEASVVNIAEARPRNEIVDCCWHAYETVDQLDTTDVTRHIVKSFVRRL
ncbi:NUDIX hydrolase, partial [Pseudomonas poae]